MSQTGGLSGLLLANLTEASAAQAATAPAPQAGRLERRSARRIG